MQADFSGKVVLVTGGASGIGAAIVRQFALQGAAVVIADVSQNGSVWAESLKREGNWVEFVRTDVRRVEDTRTAVAVAEEQFGGLDILVNSAGIFPRATLLETTDEMWDHVMDINLKGVFHACQSAVPALLRRGGGSIINIGSMNAYGGAPNLFAYAASKGGLLTLTKNLARGYARDHIRVNCVHPGWVVTEGEREVQRLEGKPDDWPESEAFKVPLGRVQTPEDIAGVVVFLASEAASQVTGQALFVDGGMGLFY